MQYRSEIDGLRAIAVVSVVLYHAEFAIGGTTLASGGYVGVDVFFVISGYLISKIIFSALQERGRVDIGRFYIRRTRRIIPALLVVVAASSAAAYQLLGPDSFSDFAKSAISSILFSSNFYFYLSSTEYGAAPGLLVPLLHTWSLSVEEQFYIALPILAWLLYRKRTGLITQTTIIAALLVVSFTACVYIQFYDQQLAFFLPFTRAWELLSGTLLALAEQRIGRAKPSVLADALAAVGLMMLGSALFTFGHATPHPGIPTMVPVVGTCLIIAFARSDRGVGAVLSARPMVAIGLISYSLYLWHYPILAFVRIGDLDVTNADKALAISAAGLLAVVTYYTVERPFRFGFSDRMVAFSAAATAAVVVVVSWWVVATGGLPQRLQSVYTAEARSLEMKALSELTNFVGDVDSQKPILLVIGDSYWRNWSIALNRHFDKDRFDILNLSYLGCNVSIQENKVIAEPRNANYEQYCLPLSNNLNDRKITARINAIFLVSHRPFEYRSNGFRFELIDWISGQSEIAVEKFVFGNYYQLDRERTSSCLSLMYRTKRDASVCLYESNYPARKDVENLPFYPASGRKYKYIDIIDIMCGYRKSECAYQYRGVPFLTDWNHLTATFITQVIFAVRQRAEDAGFGEISRYFADAKSGLGE